MGKWIILDEQNVSRILKGVSLRLWNYMATHDRLTLKISGGGPDVDGNFLILAGCEKISVMPVVVSLDPVLQRALDGTLIFRSKDDMLIECAECALSDEYLLR